MASEIIKDIDEVSLDTLVSNLLFWIDKDQNVPKLDYENIKNLVKFGFEYVVQLHCHFNY